MDVTGAACGPYSLGGGVTSEDMAIIVHTHNQLRSKLATGQETQGYPGPHPQAADMMQMVRQI